MGETGFLESLPLELPSRLLTFWVQPPQTPLPLPTDQSPSLAHKDPREGHLLRQAAFGDFLRIVTSMPKNVGPILNSWPSCSQCQGQQKWQPASSWPSWKELAQQAAQAPSIPAGLGQRLHLACPFPSQRCGRVSEDKQPTSRGVPLGPQNNQFECSVASRTRKSITAFFPRSPPRSAPLTVNFSLYMWNTSRLCHSYMTRGDVCLLMT